MTIPRPYTLKLNGHSSDGYYQAIAAFTDAWLNATLPPLARAVEHFREVKTNQPGGWVERSAEEICFEMLVLGVLLRQNGEQAVQMDPGSAWLLARLVEAQDRLPLPAVEKPVKAVRGLLYGLARGETTSGASPDMLPISGAAALVARLVDWLNAQGLNAQAERLDEWREYFTGLDEQAAQALLARCLLLAEDFEDWSEDVLGAYTQQAEAFAQHPESCGRWRYDASLVLRARVEYHLGMLGTEILTRAYRERFRAMPRKIVVIPDCLCTRSRRVTSEEDGPACPAERTSLGLKCQGCTPGCKARAVTLLGEQHGFEVYILPDDYRGLGLGACRKLEGVGVVGVSCVLTNWDAGWQVNGAGVPAQGVLLDYAGCRSHWDEEGTATDVNLKKLVEMVA